MAMGYGFYASLCNREIELSNFEHKLMVFIQKLSLSSVHVDLILIVLHAPKINVTFDGKSGTLN